MKSSSDGSSASKEKRRSKLERSSQKEKKDDDEQSLSAVKQKVVPKTIDDLRISVSVFTILKSEQEHPDLFDLPINEKVDQIIEKFQPTFEDYDVIFNVEIKEVVDQVPVI